MLSIQDFRIVVVQVDGAFVKTEELNNSKKCDNHDN